MAPGFVRRGGESGFSISRRALNIVAVVILLGVRRRPARAASRDDGHAGAGHRAGGALASSLMQSPKVAQQWERGVVLRLGRFIGLQGPGLFWIIPFVDTVELLDRSADDHDHASPPSRR